MLGKGLGRKLGQEIVRAGEKLVPASLRREFIEKDTGKQVLLFLGKLCRFRKSLFKEPRHRTSR